MIRNIIPNSVRSQYHLLSNLLTSAMGSSMSLESATEMVSTWNSKPSDQLIFDGGRSEVTQYLKAVSKIQESGASNEIVAPAVSRLKLEFRAVLTRQTEPLMAPTSLTELSSITDSTGYEFRYKELLAYELPTKQVVDYLRGLVEILNTWGHLDDCIRIYSSIRKPFVDAKFKSLQLDELGRGDSRKFLVEELRKKIENWTQAAAACIRILFTTEKEIASKIFNNLGNTNEERCFMETVRDAANNLFSFAHEVSSSRQSYERIETILILYKALLSLSTQINSLFASGSGNVIRSRNSEMVKVLEKEARRMIEDLETAVLQEQSSYSDESGGIDKLTELVMKNYINTIVKYKDVLSKIIVSKPSMTVGNLRIPEGELGDTRKTPPLAVHLTYIIVILQINLEHKSTRYQDPCLRPLFMMNNIRYIVQRVESSRDLQELVGPDYLRKLQGKVSAEKKRCLEAIRDRFYKCLSDEGVYVNRWYCCSPRVSTNSLRTKMRFVDAEVEKISSQSRWAVPDSPLRQELRQSLRQDLVPAYSNFLQRFKSHINKIQIKHSAKDLEGFISNTFSHSNPPSNRRL